MNRQARPQRSPAVARILTRGSTNKQILTLDHQRVRCEEYSQSRGWLIDRYYEEAGVSSTQRSWDQREEIVRALREAERGEFDYLVVWNSDRLARQPGERELLLTLFRRYGVEIQYADPKSPRAERSIMTELLDSLLSHFARIEVDNLVRRLKAVTRRKAELGLWVGGQAPYGYRYDKSKKTVQIVPEELSVVQEIFRLGTEERMGAMRIAMTLNARGQSKRFGEPWSTNTVRRILKNRFYCGHLVVHISDIDDPDLEEVIDVKTDRIPPAVSEETWAAAQAQRERWATHRTPPRQFTTARLFAGLLYCTCGKRMDARTHTRRWKRKDGSETVYRADEYLCRAARQCTNGCTSLSTYKQHIVDTVLARAIADRLRYMDTESFLEDAQRVIQEQNSELSRRLADHQRRVAEIDASVRKAVTTFAQEEDLEIKQRVRGHIRELQDEMKSQAEVVENLKHLLNAAKEQLLTQDGLAERLQQWPDIFSTCTDNALRRRMILDVVDKVVLSPDRHATIFLKVDPRPKEDLGSPPLPVQIATPVKDNFGSHDTASIPMRHNENEIVVALPHSKWGAVTPEATQLIRAARQDGATFGAIARLLDRQQVPAPYGWKWSARGVKILMKELTPDQFTDSYGTRTAELIQSARAAGMPYRQIVDLLNEKQIPSPFRGGKWWSSSLWRFLRRYGKSSRSEPQAT